LREALAVACDRRPVARAAARAEPLVVRRGRPRARLRRVARRPGLPLRALKLAAPLTGAVAPRRGRLLAVADAQRVKRLLEVARDVDGVGQDLGVGVDAGVE